MSIESDQVRKPEEFAFDLSLESDFLVVRVDIVGGEKVGSLVGEAYQQEEVDAALEADKILNPGAAYYHIFGPRDFMDKRDGWIHQVGEE